MTQLVGKRLRTAVAASSLPAETRERRSQIQGVSHSERHVGASLASAVPLQMHPTKSVVQQAAYGSNGML